jgi:hypothetical protein
MKLTIINILILSTKFNDRVLLYVIQKHYITIEMYIKISYVKRIMAINFLN